MRNGVAAGTWQEQGKSTVLGMRNEVENLSFHSLLAALKACGRSRNLAHGRLLHSKLQDRWSDTKNIYLGSALVDMYAKCGDLSEAAAIFSRMEQHDVVSWTALIAGLARSGDADSALDLFSRMQASGCDSGVPTLVAVLKACVIQEERGRSSRLLERAMAIHSHATTKTKEKKKRESARLDDRLACCLVDAYARGGSLRDARQVFDGIEKRDVVSWTTIVFAHARDRQEELALDFFLRMLLDGCSPDRSSLLAALKACAGLATREEMDASRGVKIKSLEVVMAIHSLALGSRCHIDKALANALIDTYAKCGSLRDACKVFDCMELRDIISWTAIITGYAQSEDHQQEEHKKHEAHKERKEDCEEESLLLFSRMYQEGCKPDRLACLAAVKACGTVAEKRQGKRWELNVQVLEKALAIHSRVSQLGFGIEKSLAASIVDMYSKCGSLADARRAFEKVAKRDTVLWNALLFGYFHNGAPELVLASLPIMAMEGCSPNAQTFVAALKAAGSLGELPMGKLLHAQVLRQGLDVAEFSLENFLLDFYAKCGSIADAEHLFGAMASPSIVAWNALLGGYSSRGDNASAFRVFGELLEEELQPDSATFVEIFSACSRAGVVDQGLGIFRAMQAKYGVAIEMRHFHCVIDALGRASNVDDAVALAKRMPFQPNSVTLTMLLDASKTK